MHRHFSKITFTMSGNDEFESVKKDIRSILLPFKNGCTLREFRKDYTNLIGQKIPFAKFKFKSEVDFFFAMPDVVYVQDYRGEPHLMGIADESTQHIQKMVSKQKTTNKRPLARVRSVNSIVKHHLYQRPSSAQKYRSSYYSQPPPRMSAQSSSNQSQRTQKNLPSDVEEEVIHLIRSYPLGISFTKFFGAYEKFYHKTFSFRPYGFFTLEECIESIPCLKKTPVDNDVFIKYISSTPTFNEPRHSTTQQQKGIVHYNNCPPKEPQKSSIQKVNEWNINEPRQSNTQQPTGLAHSNSCPPKEPQKSSIQKVDEWNIVQHEEQKSHYKPLIPQSSSNLQDLISIFDSSTIPCPTSTKYENFSLSTSGKNFEFPSLSTSKIKPEVYKDRAVPKESRPTSFVSAPVSSWTNSSQNRNNYDVTSTFDPYPKMKPIAPLPLPDFIQELRCTNVSDDNKTKCKLNNSKITDLDTFDNKTEYIFRNSKTADLDTFDNKTEYILRNSNTANLDTFDLPSSNNVAETLSERLRKNLLQIASDFPKGFWASDFPSIYKDTTGMEFDLHNLGFFDLSSFIESFPDIFYRKTITGSRMGWLICPVNSIKKDSASHSPDKFFAETIIESTRQILTAYPEGIPVKQFLHTYSLNCKEPLYITDLGFDNIENFLLSIADQVPLKINLNEGVKTVYLVEPAEIHRTKSPLVSESIPDDVTDPKTPYSKLNLSEFDFSQFVTVYTSEVNSPDDLYIQFEGETTSDVMNKLYDDLEEFYNGSESEDYKMKETHIKPNAMCAAVWNDNHWYRTQILSITLTGEIYVLYVDYGTKSLIQKEKLRYLKSVYSSLPAQAVKARLAFIQPANEATRWHPITKSIILEICRNKKIMCQVENIKDDGLEVLLCDTSSSDDIYVNDVLINKGFAEPLKRKDSMPPSPIMDPSMLQAVFAMTQSLSPQNLEQMMKSFSLGASLSTPTLLQPPPIAPPSASPLTDLFPLSPGSLLPTGTQIYQKQQPSWFSNPAAAFGTSPLLANASSSKNPLIERDTPRIDQPSPASSECEVFNDEDDALFDEWYQKASNVSKRYVKRIKTVDDYTFHILIIYNEPHISGGDIAHLFWPGRDYNHFLQRLSIRGIVLPSSSLSEEDNEEMFEQFRRFNVRGAKKTLNTSISSLVVYPLKCLLKILNVFGHPSVELRKEILHEISDFSLEKPAWQEVSEVEFTSIEETDEDQTDDSKLGRRCLYDLKNVKVGMQVKRQKEMSKLSLLSPEDQYKVQCDIRKMDSLGEAVEKRIKEIEQICQSFADV